VLGKASYFPLLIYGMVSLFNETGSTYRRWQQAVTFWGDLISSHRQALLNICIEIPIGKISFSGDTDHWHVFTLLLII